MEWSATEERSRHRRLAGQRGQLQTTLADTQEEIVGLDIEIVQRMVEASIPDAASIRFEARLDRGHWTEVMLTLVSITDRRGHEVAWRDHLPAADLKLIEELQRELTDCYAIPKDEVSLTISLV